jgi:hypothetical protein
MPIEAYVGQLEPQDQDAIIWRFMNSTKFLDLMATSELYFCRADLFHDQDEGLPPESFFSDLNSLDLVERRQIDGLMGSIAQLREAFYINCWHLFREETWQMWREYGKDGVAICSRYRLLKASLDAMSDRAYIGLVRYEPSRIMRGNLFSFITTKRRHYAGEQEVRAFLWIADPHAGINRHIDSENRVHPRPLTPPPATVPEGQRRKVNLQKLITEVIVTPLASSQSFDEISQLVGRSHTIAVQPSALTQYRELLP